MTEPQKEYIITEETRREIIDRLSKPFSEEVRKEIERIKQMHIELLPVEMSRIYNLHAKSDAVLEELDKIIDRFPKADGRGIKELRQQEKGA